ncbi:hypothetical protein ABPG75_002846 [Micractinium tetrahymenae]
MRQQRSAVLSTEAVAVVDAHNVARAIICRDQLCDAVPLERLLQGSGSGLSLLPGLKVRLKKPAHVSGARPDSQEGAPIAEELLELQQSRQAAGAPPWTAGEVSRLRWQLRLLEVWLPRLQRIPASGELALAPAALRQLQADLQDGGRAQFYLPSVQLSPGPPLQSPLAQHPAAARQAQGLQQQQQQQQPQMLLDPEWQLEWRCLQLLSQQGRQTAESLLQLAGYRTLPPWLAGASASYKAQAEAFRGFLRRRPEIFEVARSGRVEASPGAASFLRYKRRLLQYPSLQPAKRATIRKLKNEVPAASCMQAWLKRAANKEVQSFLDEALSSCLHVAGSGHGAYAELRPFEPVAGLPPPPSAREACHHEHTKAAGCKFGMDCIFRHAPMRGEELTMARGRRE